MSQPIKNTSIPAARQVNHPIFDQVDILGSIFERSQGKSFPLVSKAFYTASQHYPSIFFNRFKQDLKTEVLQKRHPTLSSVYYKRQKPKI